MDLSAEKVLMLAVGAIGVFAVYKLVTAPKNQAPLDQEQAPRLPPQPQPTPTTGLPAVAGPLGTPPANFPLVTSPTSPTIHLANSKAYRGRLELAPNATPSDVLALLTQLGLEPSTAQVYSTPTQAAPNIPAFALQNAGQGTRWFHARYLAPGAIDVPRPPQLVAMWIATGAPTPILNMFGSSIASQRRSTLAPAIRTLTPAELLQSRRPFGYVRT